MYICMFEEKKEEEEETKEGIRKGYALRNRSGSVPLHVLALLRTARIEPKWPV